MVSYFQSLSRALWLHSAGSLSKDGMQEIEQNAARSSANAGQLPILTWQKMMEEQVYFCVLKPEAMKGSVSRDELIAICHLVQRQKPKFLFEIGTYEGRCSINLIANAAPMARLYTLDLPAADVASARLRMVPQDKEFILKTSIGRLIKEQGDNALITQLTGDSGQFDFRTYAGKMEFVLIDGSHSFEYVLNDTQAALRILKADGGTIVWCHYGDPKYPEVTKALDKLLKEDHRFRNVRRLEGTNLAILWVERVDRARSTQPI